MDLNQCVEAKPTLARNMPEPGCFTQYLQSLGVNKESHLVLYDRGAMVSSARAWWTLRVCTEILNVVFIMNIFD